MPRTEREETKEKLRKLENSKDAEHMLVEGRAATADLEAQSSADGRQVASGSKYKYCNETSVGKGKS